LKTFSGGETTPLGGSIICLEACVGIYVDVGILLMTPPASSLLVELTTIGTTVLLASAALEGAGMLAAHVTGKVTIVAASWSESTVAPIDCGRHPVAGIGSSVRRVVVGDEG
jgi:hypothetical protein